MAKKDNNKCVAYLRYSSKNQGKYSIDYQKKTVEKYCAKHGLEMVDYYIDEAYSAKNDNRPEFQMLLEDAREKPVWKTMAWRIHSIQGNFRKKQEKPCAETTMAKSDML